MSDFLREVHGYIYRRDASRGTKDRDHDGNVKKGFSNFDSDTDIDFVDGNRNIDNGITSLATNDFSNATGDEMNDTARVKQYFYADKVTCSFHLPTPVINNNR